MTASDAGRLPNDVVHHPANPVGMRVTQAFPAALRNIVFRDHSSSNGIVDIVVDIGNDIRNSDYLALKGHGHLRFILAQDLPFPLTVLQDPIPDFLREIQSSSLFLEEIDY